MKHAPLTCVSFPRLLNKCHQRVCLFSSNVDFCGGTAMETGSTGSRSRLTWCLERPLSLAGGCPLRLYLIFALYVTSDNDTGCAGVRATQWPHLNLERACLQMRPLLGSWASTAEFLTHSHTALGLMLMSLLLL